MGSRHGQVLVIGDGVVGYHAAKSAWGLGAERVAVAGLLDARRDLLHRDISPQLEFFVSSPEAIAERIASADLVVGGVLRHGAKADYVVTEAMVKSMLPGSVIVDVSIDQGGCVATSRPTSHSHPVFEKHGVIHYCVTNMPGAYPRTSTLALTQATLPYVLALADRGVAAMQSAPGLRKAVNVIGGAIVYRPVAESLNLMDVFREFS
jgi:alanine dehydrogenase